MFWGISSFSSAGMSYNKAMNLTPWFLGTWISILSYSQFIEATKFESMPSPRKGTGYSGTYKKECLNIFDAISQMKGSRNLLVSLLPDIPFMSHFILERFSFWAVNTENVAPVLSKNLTFSPSTAKVIRGSSGEMIWLPGAKRGAPWPHHISCVVIGCCHGLVLSDPFHLWGWS